MSENIFRNANALEATETFGAHTIPVSTENKLSRPKILYLTTYDLEGPSNGGTLRNLNVLRHLRKIGEVNVVLASDWPFDFDKRTTKILGGFPILDIIQFQRTRNWNLRTRLKNQLDPRFLDNDGVLALDEDRNRLLQLALAHDLIWIHTLKIANRFNRWHWPSTVVDIDDIPSFQCRTNILAEKMPLRKVRLWRQTALWQQREKFLLERFDALCVCSEEDKKLLGDSSRIFVLPNGSHTPLKTPERKPSNPPRIGFIGNFRHPPNRDGIRWFEKKVWPLILKKNPRARLRMIGQETEKCAHIPNADILGWMPETENEIATWNLSVVPIRIGAGTRVKLAEAFSRKCPTVSTSMGAYGYEVANGEELLLADSPEDFAAKCIRLLENPDEAHAMAERAWQKFLQNWTWEAQAGRVAAVAETVLRSRLRQQC